MTLATLLFGFCGQAANSPKAPVFPTDIRIETNVVFLTADRKERADLYFPVHLNGTGKVPAVLMIHGGGWVGGRRDEPREITIGSTLARNGYLAMSVDYLMSPAHQAVWPTNLWDCKTAVRWLRKNADRLDIDPDRIGVLGGSAGGHLAAMVALTTPSDGLDPANPNGDVSCRVRCCVDLYGIADIGIWHNTSMLGKTRDEAPELYRRASPVTYVRSNSVPFLILHGTADTIVDCKQSELLENTFRQVNAEARLIIIPNAKHSFDLQPPQRDLRPVVLDFLKRHLAKAGA